MSLVYDFGNGDEARWHMGIFSKLRDMVVGDPAAAELERMELEQARRLAQEAEAGGPATRDTAIGPKLRRRYRFVGTVQGVGFRWTTVNLANSAGATGWVKNERDGSVTAEIQGVAEQIQAVIDGLDRYYNQRRFSMGGFSIGDVRDIDVDDSEHGFDARY